MNAVFVFDKQTSAAIGKLSRPQLRSRFHQAAVDLASDWERFTDALLTSTAWDDDGEGEESPAEALQRGIETAIWWLQVAREVTR
jgi:hypothetical protein